jgi:hypothetical protein
MKIFLGLLLGVIGGILIGPTLAVKVQWPVWLAILVVAVDGFLIVDVPYQFSEFFANMSLHRKGWGSVADGMGAGCLLFVLFGLIPIALGGWIVWNLLK